MRSKFASDQIRLECDKCGSKTSHNIVSSQAACCMACGTVRDRGGQ